MKRWEKYERQVKELGLEEFAMDKKTLEIAGCSDINCNDCEFQGNCIKHKVEWLYGEENNTKSKMESLF